MAGVIASPNRQLFLDKGRERFLKYKQNYSALKPTPFVLDETRAEGQSGLWDELHGVAQQSKQLFDVIVRIFEKLSSLSRDVETGRTLNAAALAAPLRNEARRLLGEKGQLEHRISELLLQARRQYSTLKSTTGRCPTKENSDALSSENERLKTKLVAFKAQLALMAEQIREADSGAREAAAVDKWKRAAEEKSVLLDALKASVEVAMEENGNLLRERASQAERIDVSGAAAQLLLLARLCVRAPSTSFLLRYGAKLFHFYSRRCLIIF